MCMCWWCKLHSGDTKLHGGVLTAIHCTVGTLTDIPNIQHVNHHKMIWILEKHQTFHWLPCEIMHQWYIFANTISCNEWKEEFESIRHIGTEGYLRINQESDVTFWKSVKCYIFYWRVKYHDQACQSCSIFDSIDPCLSCYLFGY